MPIEFLPLLLRWMTREAIGIKTLDRNNTVQFYNIQIVGDETNQLDPGIWVTGMQGDITLVTLGQEIVFPGQIVEVNFDWDQ